MRNFKETSYIKLLYNKEEINVQNVEIAFYDFTYEVYHFCTHEQDAGIKYFTLQYLRAFLISLQSMPQQTNPNLYTIGAIQFVEGAIEWVIKEGKAMPQLNEDKCEVPQQVTWTGKVIHLMEFIYGADTLKNFNNGQLTIKQVAAYFSKVLGIEIKDPSGCYVSMRERIKESRTSYIDSMREALLERMEKDDEKTYRRKK